MSGMGLLGGLFDSPENMGLLMAAASMAERSGPSTRPSSFGQVLSSGLLGGAQGYQNVQDSQFQREYRTAQMDQYKSKTAASKAQQEALARVAAGYQMDPNFKPSMGDLLAIDPDSAIKGMMPGSAVDFGLEPKIGINPATNKTSYFIQDKRGNTKWIDADVPKNLQYVPGNEYQPASIFDKRDGSVSRPGNAPSSGVAPLSGIGGPVSPLGAASSAAAAPTVDSLAPWNNITSPKEQDQMKGRVYDQSSKALQDLRAAVGQGRTNMRDLERFGELNRKTATGGILDQLSYVPFRDEDKKEMEAIVARLAPAQRVEGSGTTSDRDISLYLQGLPGIDKPGGVNKAIRDQFRGQLTNRENELAFKEAYLTDRGHLAGADEARSQAVENGKTGGLDLSKLTADQIAFLRQQDPDAVDRGVARLTQNSSPASGSPAKASANIPQAAINHLKFNPKLRDQFDAKYGPGAAASVLGG